MPSVDLYTEVLGRNSSSYNWIIIAPVYQTNASNSNISTLFNQYRGVQSDAEEGGGEEDEEPLENMEMSQHVAYMAPLLRIVSMLHLFTAFAMMVAYYCLKVGAAY